VKNTFKLSAVLLSILAIVIMMFPCIATAAGVDQNNISAQTAAQNYVNNRAVTNPELTHWKGATVNLLQKYKDVKGNLCAYMFAVVTNKSVGNVLVGSAQYNFDIFSASEATAPAIPTATAIVSAFTQLGLNVNTDETLKPAQFLCAGIDQLYAVYNSSNKQQVAIDLLYGNSQLLSSLKNNLPSPEQYLEGKNLTDLARSATMTPNLSAWSLTMAHWSGPGQAWCGPCSGVSIGNYYRNQVGYFSLYDPSFMYTVLFTDMQTDPLGPTWPWDYGPGWITMANGSNSTYNFTYYYDSIVTGGDYWRVADDIYNGHPTALEITNALHWWAIRGYDFSTGTHLIRCTDSQNGADDEEKNFDALGWGLYLVTIRN
jgi:hypothetical protein